MPRKISYAGLRQKAWDRQSKYIRLKARINEEEAKCYTCDRIYPITEMDAGHYKHGDALDFEEEINIRAQCVRCNRYLSGNAGEYLSRLIKEIGYDPTDVLERLKHEVVKYTRSELEAIVEYYDKKIAELE